MSSKIKILYFLTLLLFTQRPLPVKAEVPGCQQGLTSLFSIGAFTSYDILLGDAADSFDFSRSIGINSLLFARDNHVVEFSFNKKTWKDKIFEDDLTLRSFNLNYNYVVKDGMDKVNPLDRDNFFPYFFIGPGYYSISDNKNDKAFGINCGAGIVSTYFDIDASPDCYFPFVMDISTNYNHIFNEGKDINYIELKVGFRFLFPSLCCGHFRNMRML